MFKTDSTVIIIVGLIIVILCAAFSALPPQESAQATRTDSTPRAPKTQIVTVFADFLNGYAYPRYDAINLNNVSQRYQTAAYVTQWHGWNCTGINETVIIFNTAYQTTVYSCDNGAIAFWLLNLDGTIADF